MSGTHTTIGLLDHLGHGNLGDDATLDAVMHNIKVRWPAAVIIGLSLNPYDTKQRHGIPSYAIRRDSKAPPENDRPAAVNAGLKVTLKGMLRRYHSLLMVLRAINFIAIRAPKALFQELVFLAESLRITRSLDFLIICGGGQLLDSWGGPWSFPYTVFKWILLAKLARAKCYIVNVGAGPLRHRLSHYFVRYALLSADYASFRDDTSKVIVRQIGFSGQGQVFPDSVYSLDISPFNISKHDTHDRSEPTVGIAPMGYCDPRLYWEKDERVYSTLIRQLAQFGSQLVKDKYRLRLFSTDIYFDAQAIEDVKLALERDPTIVYQDWIAQESISGLSTLLSRMSQMDYVVTSRFHGVIFAHMLNKPVLALSHHEKVRTLMRDIGLAEYCVDIRAVTADLLIALFRRLVANRYEVKARMAITAECYRRKLENQFDGLFRRRELAAD